MCSISGAIFFGNGTNEQMHQARMDRMLAIISAARERGRDSFGAVLHWIGATPVYGRTWDEFVDEFMRIAPHAITTKVIVNNNRAEPTTEAVAKKTLADCQPFITKGWAVAHNGTIANDKDFKDRAHPTIDSGVLPPLFAEINPIDTTGLAVLCAKLKGSFAIAATDGIQLFLAANYKPLAYMYDPMTDALFFSSLPKYLGPQVTYQLYSGGIKELPPYTAMVVSPDRSIQYGPLNRDAINNKALVVCSGGLDSAVAATVAKRRDGLDVTLLHFLYNCRAQAREHERIAEIARVLDVPYKVIDLDLKKMVGGSPLFSDQKEYAGGVEGAEFAHEWVPARNLILLSVATGYAEAHGYGRILLGNNLEEAGAYPDNEMIFIDKLNAVLPFAIQNERNIVIEMPVGNLVKHEIVALGKNYGAPFEHTWSCYYGGERHCGKCGPCFMRKTAFEINGIKDPVFEI